MEGVCRYFGFLIDWPWGKTYEKHVKHNGTDVVQWRFATVIKDRKYSPSYGMCVALFTTFGSLNPGPVSVKVNKIK